MPAKTPPPAPPRTAESVPSWSAFAGLLAPAAPCDCQLLGMALAADLEARTKPTARAPKH